VTLKSWFYDHVASRYYDRELAEATEATRRRCLERLALSPGDTVLDLGCGTGLNQPFIAEAIGVDGSIIGVDASGGMLERARSRAEEGGYADRLQLIKGDARRVNELVPVQPDAVMTTLFFSVVPQWRQVFQRSFDLLKPGGRFLVMDTYWVERHSALIRVLLLKYAAKAAVPGFEPLKETCADFDMEDFPPDSELPFYIATGTKATGTKEAATGL